MVLAKSKLKHEELAICPLCGYEYDPGKATTVYILNKEYKVCPRCHSAPVTTTLEPLESEEEPSEWEEYPSEEEPPSEEGEEEPPSEEEEIPEEEDYDFSED
jgi:ribosome-binding protein aMBF1 (putative translation factor)